MSIFSNIASRRPQSSDFNLSHSRKFGFIPGRCIPTLCQEVLPSDKWHYGMSALIRFMPMQAPIMHMVDVYNYSFAVPARLTMGRGKFETFITGGKNGDGKDAQGNTIEIPYIMVNMRADSQSFATSINYNDLAISMTDTGGSPVSYIVSLLDFLGVAMATPVASDTYTWKLNMMPVIAFWRIWNQYFRDQNLHPDYEELYPGIFESSGDITAAVFEAFITNSADPDLFFNIFTLPAVCWEKDYFTSALPFAQRGNPVETPLTGTATVTYMPESTIERTDGAPLSGGAGANVTYTGGGTTAFVRDSAGNNSRIENIDEVTLESGGFTINQLRLAARLQEWLEKMARGGARYIEQMKSQFGVTSSDARLQRPEFLGGGKINVSISEVLQTSEDGSTPLANMAGHGVASGGLNSFHKFFEEHCFIISIMFLRPKPAYQQGIPRLWTNRFDKLDWAWPSFAHLGEQAVIKRELYFQGEAATDLEEFGYQSRYAEYKYIPSTVHGEFKTSLNFWHWGRILEDNPTLSKEFVECDPGNRIFNVVDTNTANMYCIVYNKIKARRPLPYFGSPTL